MNVVQTASNGIVNADTIFDFKQEGNLVSASYSGGRIKQGYLIGHLINNVLSFSYCQYRLDGTMDHGNSSCILSKENGKLVLEEKFEMNTNNAVQIGINVFKEL